MTKSRSPVLLSGNEAIGAGAVAAGCQLYAGYPITPQNELTAYMAEQMPKHNRIFIQAESEIAAISMVYGAASTGARAMTSSSSPGISLKQEGISYLCGSRLPAVIVNVMRAGPGLGNVWPAQSDYFQATKGGGHGDYHIIVLAPASVQESFDLTVEAFSLTFEHRVPVMILSDGMLGQMMEGANIPPFSSSIDWPQGDWSATGALGRPSRIVRSLFMERDGVEQNNFVLQKKYRELVKTQQRYQASGLDDADVVIVAYGSSSRMAHEAVVALRQEGIKAGLFRPICLWPFPSDSLEALSRRVPKILVVEMSYGQMVEDVRLSVSKETEVRFFGRSGGGIPSPEAIEAEVRRWL